MDDGKGIETTPAELMIRIIFRCWVDWLPYDESRYLSALQKRGSPVLKFAAEAKT